MSTPPLIPVISSSQNKKKIHQLTNMMQSLAFSVHTLQCNPDVLYIVSHPQLQLANTFSES